MVNTSTKKKTAAKKAAPKTSKAKAKVPAKKVPAKKAAAKKAPARKKNWKSRAVLRMVEPGSQVECIVCGERVKFQAKMRHQQAICNIYEKSMWVRVDHYHFPCYKEAKEPYGPVDEG
jgi:hypothetical protein